MIACAKGGNEGLGPDDEAGPATEGGADRDVYVIATDTGEPMLDPDGGPPPPPVDDSGSICTKKIVINEISTNGPAGASDEFVELYNPTACAVPLANWSIKYESKTGAGGSPAGYKFVNGDSIAAKGYFVVGSASFAGTKDAQMTPGLAQADGQVGLVDDAAKTIDGIAYGAVTAGSYREGQPAPSPVVGKTIGRLPNGVDSNNNMADVKPLVAPSPGAAN